MMDRSKSSANIRKFAKIAEIPLQRLPTAQMYSKHFWFHLHSCQYVCQYISYWETSKIFAEYFFLVVLINDRHNCKSSVRQQSHRRQQGKPGMALIEFVNIFRICLEYLNFFGVIYLWGYVSAAGVFGNMRCSGFKK